VLFKLALYILAVANASTGGYDTNLGKKVESCLRRKMVQARATTMTELRPGQKWSCVTMNYFWDEQNNVRYFLENYAPVHYLFDKATISNGHQTINYPRNVVDPARPVDYTVFVYPEQFGVREDIRLGMEHSLDYIVADGNGYLMVERSVHNAPYNLSTRPSLAQSPFALLDYPAVREYESRTGRSVPDLYRKVIEYRACFDSTRPNLKSQVPCFGDLDNVVFAND
jgi:hypothetical protein